MATPAWPPPTTSTSVFSTDIEILVWPSYGLEVAKAGVCQNWLLYCPCWTSAKHFLTMQGIGFGYEQIQYLSAHVDRSIDSPRSPVYVACASDAPLSPVRRTAHLHRLYHIICSNS